MKAKKKAAAKNVIQLDEFRPDIVKTSMIEKFIKARRFRGVVIVGLPHDKKLPPQIINLVSSPEDRPELSHLLGVASDLING